MLQKCCANNVAVIHVLQSYYQAIKELGKKKLKHKMLCDARTPSGEYQFANHNVSLCPQFN